MPSSVTVSATDNFDAGDVLIASRDAGFIEEPVRFPLALATVSDLLNYTNTFPSVTTVPTLAIGLLPTDLTATLASGTGSQFPLTAFEASIDDEIVFVITRNGDLLNIVRGAEGTTSFTHVIGANVQLLITAKGHNSIVSEIISIENFLGINGQNIRTITPIEVAIPPTTRGDFQIAHGFGKTPNYAFIQMTSDGLIRFQTTRYDATYLFLNASNDGLTGYVEVF